MGFVLQKQTSREEFGHMFTSQEKHHRSGPWRDVEGDHSLRALAVKLGWAVAVEQLRDTWLSQQRGTGAGHTSSTGHRWPEDKHVVALAVGTKRRRQQRTAGEEMDAWSKRSFATSEALSSCEATCSQGLHRRQGLLLFQGLDILVSVQESTKQGLKGSQSPCPGLEMC